jgi:exopolysaccharide biosynthesis polyprenyl glycosylphosphotransferase
VNAAASSLRPAAAAGPRDSGSWAGPGAGAPAIAGGLRRPVPLAWVLPLADAMALAAALAAASVATGAPAWQAAAYSATALLALWASGLQRLRIAARVSGQAGRIVAMLAGPALILAPWTSAGTALAMAAWSAALVLAGRVAVTTALRAARLRGYLPEPALLLGPAAAGEQIAGLLREHPELGLQPFGLIGDQPPASAAGLPLLGGAEDLGAVVTRLGIQRVIVCWPDDQDEEFARVLRACRELRADTCVVARQAGLGAAMPRACRDEIGGIPLLPLRRGRASADRVLKRMFDVAAAAILLVLAAPVIGLLALVIKVRRRHSVLFRQVRVVGAGRLAEIIKLRTLGSHPDADTCWVVPERQLTPLGQWLRSTHLDELPQLVNVLRGDMSLVGPRPERPYFAQQFAREIPRYDDRHRMRAGLTGFAQVHGLHGDTSIHERVRLDNFYIDNWSLWLDVVILARTVATIAGGRQAGKVPVPE